MNEPLAPGYAGGLPYRDRSFYRAFTLKGHHHIVYRPMPSQEWEILVNSAIPRSPQSNAALDLSNIEQGHLREIDPLSWIACLRYP